MKQMYLITLLFLSSFAVAGAQDFIGLTDDKIKDIMTRERSGFLIDENYRNDDFRYLKYISKAGDETWLIFLGENGKCNGVRITCENSSLGAKISEMSRLYTAAGKDRWNYRSRGDEISVDLKKETYFFKITYTQRDKKAGSGNNRAA